MRRLLSPGLALLCAACVAALCACAAEPRGGSGGEPRSGIDRLADRLAGELADRPGGREIRAVAVPDFQDAWGDTSELGRHLSQELAAALSRTLDRAGDGAPEVLDRRRVNDLLDERLLQSQGLISAAERRESEIGGVDALVTGRIESYADTVRLSILVLDFSGNGAILVADQASLPRTARLHELEGRTLKVRRSDPDGPFDLEYPYPAQQVLRLPPDLEPKRLQVELKICGRLEEAVFCLFSVEALDRDRSVALFGSSRAVLRDGSRVEAAQVQIGGSTASTPRGRAGDLLTRGVPMAAMVRFDGIPFGVGEILLLELEMYGEDAEFSQVPIERV